MANKKTKNKGEKKIVVREFIETRFKEIKKDKEKEDKFTEGNLEEGLGSSNLHKDSEGFVDFTTGRRFAPVLESGDNVQGNLENMPGPAVVKNTETVPIADEKKYIAAYDSIAYSPENREERNNTLIREMKQTGLIISQEQSQMGMPMRTERIRDWHEIQDTGGRSDSVLSAQRIEEDRSLPFEKRKYRPR